MKSRPPKLHSRQDFWYWYRYFCAFGDLYGLFMVKAKDMTCGQPMGPDWNHAVCGDHVLLKDDYKSYLYRLLGIKDVLPTNDLKLHKF